MSDTPSGSDVLRLTAQIVSAHVGHNALQAEALPALIRSVFATLSGIGVVAAEPERPQPAVPVKKSIFADHIVCLEDGKKLKMLKRHLATSYNMTPAQYRERWGLPRDYPMVAPDYAAQRSRLAKSIGLGRKAGTKASPKSAAKTAAKAAATPGKRGRKPAA